MQHSLIEKESIIDISNRIFSLLHQKQRLIVAVAGPPASGKSTLAEELVNYLNESERFGQASLLPMDGFHLDNRLLQRKALIGRKGSPETFDIHGLLMTLQRLRTNKEDLIHPVFDRNLDMAIAGAGLITRETSIIIVEGNYLLLNQPIWQELVEYFDYRVFMSVPVEELKKRLIKRWLTHGFNEEVAMQKIQNNDFPNARLIIEQSLQADYYVGHSA